MKKDKIKKFWNNPVTRLILVLFSIAFVFLLWWIISLIVGAVQDAGTQNIFFPGPEKVIPVFFQMLGQKDTYVNIGYSLLRMLVSFLICFAIAIVFGIISGVCKPIKKFLKPTILVLRSTPTAAIIILLFIIFNNFEHSMFTIMFLIMFPIMYDAIVSGIENIDKSIIDALRLDTKIYNPKAIFTVLLPNAAPYIFLGIFQSLGLGLKVSIMAESMTATNDGYGIGIAFRVCQESLRYDMMIAYTIYAILIIALLDFILGILKNKVEKAK